MSSRPAIQWRHSCLATLLGTPDLHVEQYYRGCPSAWQNEYLRGLEPPSGDPATIGIVDHSIAAAWARWIVSRLIKFSKWNAHKFEPRFLELVEQVIAQEKPPAHLHDEIRERAMLWFYTFELKQPDATHIFERRFWFDMDWQPLVPVESLDNRDMIRGILLDRQREGLDSIGMTLDHCWFVERREVAFLDEKFGFTALRLDVSEQARENEQLQFYTRGVFALFPECEIVHSAIHGVLGGERNKSEATWIRGAVDDKVDERLGRGVDAADALWEVHGEADYPATPDNSVCRFCNRVGGCPHGQELITSALEHGIGISA